MPTHRYRILLHPSHTRVIPDVPYMVDGQEPTNLGPSFDAYDEAQSWLRDKRIEAVEQGVATDPDFTTWLRRELTTGPVVKREKVVKTCEHCQFFYQFLLNGGACQNPKVKERVWDQEGGPAIFDKTFGCMFWTKKDLASSV